MPDKARTISSRGEPVVPFLNPFTIFVHLWRYRDLIRQLTWREVIGRYKGSYLGLAWSLVNPLIMLAIYTFIFSVIFKARWGVDPAEGTAVFALTLFMGIITFNIFAEVAAAGPTLILGNVNFVKKVVFPLEILIVVRFLSALVNALFGLAVLFAGLACVYGHLSPTTALLPLVWLPVMFFSLGWGYFLASLGVFIRDLGVTVNIIITMLFFLSPIFYPVSAVPERFQIICRVNPIAVFVEDARRVVIWGSTPDWHWFFGGLVLSVMIMVAGFVWFMKTKKTFADVV